MAKKSILGEVIFEGAVAEKKGFEAMVDSEIPELPADAGSKTYALYAVNGVLTWVEE